MQQRDHALDIFRGFGILLVVLGHIYETPYLIRLWLATFHMPLFFLCSGMLYSGERHADFFSFLKAKLKTLVLPYFCLGICLWVLMHLWETLLVFLRAAEGPVRWEPLHFLFSLLLADRLHTYYFSLWFLCVLFLSELVFFPLARLARRRIWILPIVAVAANLLEHLLLSRVKGGVWSFDLVPTAVSFLAVGYRVRLRGKDAEALSRPWLLPVFALLHLVFAALNTRVLGGYTALYQGEIGSPLWYFPAALCGSWAVWILARISGRLRITEFFGRNSLVVYAFQNSFAIPVAAEIAGFAASRSVYFSDPVLQWLMILGLSLSICAILALVIRRFFPWMLGRPTKRIPAKKTLL